MIDEIKQEIMRLYEAIVQHKRQRNFFEDPLKEYCHNLKDVKILDIGITKGRTRESYFDKTCVYETIDIRPHLKPTYLYDLRNMSGVSDNRFDLIICFSTLEHIYPNVETAIQEIWRVLKPSGKLFIDMPFMIPYHGRKGDSLYHDYFRMTDEGFRVFLENNHFEIESFEYYPIENKRFFSKFHVIARKRGKDFL